MCLRGSRSRHGHATHLDTAVDLAVHEGRISTEEICVYVANTNVYAVYLDSLSYTLDIYSSARNCDAQERSRVSHCKRGVVV